MAGIVDERLLLWISSLAGRFPLLDSVMRTVVNDYFVPIALSLVLIGLWFMGRGKAEREHYQRTCFYTAAGVGIAQGFVELCNCFYFRPRPFIAIPNLVDTAESIFYYPTDPSFPSNIAAITFAGATGVWFINRKLGGFLYFLALLVSFARVYAAVHYPLDIIGGAAIGALASYVALRLAVPLIEPFPTLLLRLLRRFCLAEQVNSIPSAFPFQRRYLKFFEGKAKSD